MAVLIQREAEQPWAVALHALTLRYSSNRDTHSYGVFQRLAGGSDFDDRGQFESEPVPHLQPIGDYVESIHSRSGCSRNRMSLTSQASFDQQARALLEPYAVDGCLRLRSSDS